MSDDYEKLRGDDGGSDESDDANDDRPTVAPPFDPVAFAKEVLAPPSSEGGGGRGDFHTRATPQGLRAAYATRNDPDEIENARQRSLESPAEASTRQSPGLMPARRRISSPGDGRVVPSGLLSLANQRIPSSLPPRFGGATAAATARRESPEPIGAVDREWVELATRPPPAEEDAFAASFSTDDEQRTQPPPPMQQELIDALAQGRGPKTPLGMAKPYIPVPPSTAPNPGSRARRDSVRAVPKLTPVPSRPAAPAPPAPAEPPTTREMNDRMSLGDYTGALDIAEKLLEIDATDVGVIATAETCRSVLRQMYTARIGPLERVPVVMVPRDQLRWLSIDHRAGFVLSLVDGVSTLEMILDVSGMPELDALRILSDLAQQRVISFR